MRGAVRGLLPGLVVLLCPAGSDPATIRVPLDQPTISAALAVAAAGDEVVLDCGTYQEYGLHLPGGVTLRSATGAADCAVLWTAWHDLMFIDDAVGTRLRGLTFTARYGRAFTITNSSAVQFESCRFTGCSSNHHEVIRATDSDLDLRDCSFVDNPRGTWYAGAVVDVEGSVSLTDCLFACNAAPAGYPGYAVACSGSGPLSVRSCRFDHFFGKCLTVQGTGALAEGTWFGRTDVVGIVAGVGGSLHLRDCVAESTGVSNYGYHVLEAVSGAALTIESCTINRSFQYRSLIGSRDATIDVTRSIFANNRTALVFDCRASSLRIRCSDIFNSIGPVFGPDTVPDTAGVFSADPLFCNPAAGDYTLDGLSPCLPGRSPCGEVVGALGIGCGTVGLDPMSWGRIKQLYR